MKYKLSIELYMLIHFYAYTNKQIANAM